MTGDELLRAARLVLDGYQRRIELEDAELRCSARLGGPQRGDGRDQLVAGRAGSGGRRSSPSASTRCPADARGDRGRRLGRAPRAAGRRPRLPARTRRCSAPRARRSAPPSTPCSTTSRSRSPPPRASGSPTPPAGATSTPTTTSRASGTRHPRVTAAIARQSRQINTHTRYLHPARSSSPSAWRRPARRSSTPSCSSTPARRPTTWLGGWRPRSPAIAAGCAPNRLPRHHRGHRGAVAGRAGLTAPAPRTSRRGAARRLPPAEPRRRAFATRWSACAIAACAGGRDPRRPRHQRRHRRPRPRLRPRARAATRAPAGSGSPTRSRRASAAPATAFWGFAAVRHRPGLRHARQADGQRPPGRRGYHPERHLSAARRPDSAVQHLRRQPGERRGGARGPRRHRGRARARPRAAHRSRPARALTSCGRDPAIGDVRGVGLAIGVEFVADPRAASPTAAAQAVRDRMRQPACWSAPPARTATCSRSGRRWRYPRASAHARRGLRHGGVRHATDRRAV